MNNEIKPQSKLAREYQETKQDSQVRFLRYREGAAVYGMSQGFLMIRIISRRTFVII